MKEYVFSEKNDIETMIAKKYVDESNLCKTIRKLARYYYYECHLKNDDLYNKINDYMKENCSDYTEVGYYDSIRGCIRDVTKGVWKNIDHVIITKREIEIIQSLNDDRKEKIAFVLLADAKFDNTYKGLDINLSYLSISDLYRLSRVTMPIKDRAIFLHFLYENDLVELNLNPKTDNKRLKYICNDDEVAIVLNESNYKELAFTYMNFKYGGYKECKLCGRLFKIKGNSQYCKQCTPKYNKIEFKIKNCINCGMEFVVDARNNTKCRCDMCQNEHVKEYDRKRKQNT